MPIGIYIEFEALPGRLEGLIAKLREEGETCMRVDDGCLRMELATPQAPDNRVMLMELWRDRAALQAHKDRPDHSHAWQSDFVASKRVAVCDVIASPGAPQALRA